jgi:hypothetical protein
MAPPHRCARVAWLSAALLIAGCSGTPPIARGAEATDGGPASALDAAAAEANDPVCGELASLSVGNVMWSPTAIAPGDTATLTMTLTETGSQNCCSGDYPGIVVTSDNSLVTLDPPTENALYAIIAGSSAVLTWTVAFDGSIPGMTTVKFHAAAAIGAQHPRCSSAGAIDFLVTVQ